MKRKTIINITKQTKKTTSKAEIDKIPELMNITKNENKEKTIPSKRDNITLLKNQIIIKIKLIKKNV